MAQCVTCHLVTTPEWDTLVYIAKMYLAFEYLSSKSTDKKFKIKINSDQNNGKKMHIEAL